MGLRESVGASGETSDRDQHQVFDDSNAGEKSRALLAGTGKMAVLKASWERRKTADQGPLRGSQTGPGQERTKRGDGGDGRKEFCFARES